MLSNSIVAAELKLEQQRAICIQAASDAYLRNLRLDTFAARDAVDARWADLLSLSEEHIKLRHEKGLTRAARRARSKSLTERSKHAGQRWRDADKQSNDIFTSQLDRLEREVRETRDLSSDEFVDRFTQSLGC